MISNHLNEIDPEFENPPGRLLFNLSLNSATPFDLGCTGSGDKQAVAITGGQFDGPRLQGRVVHGEDWIKNQYGCI